MSQSQQFLYSLQVTRPEMLTQGPSEEEQAAVTEHFNYLQSLCDEGIVVLAGRTLNTDESSFGIVILEAADEREARQRMENDPTVRKGVMHAHLYPYRIAMMREGSGSP